MRYEELIKAYFDSFESERLPYIKCTKCGKVFYYPRTFCINCNSTDLQVKTSEGKGKIFTMTKFNNTIYGIVELKEGFRLYTNIIDENGKADIGVDVEVRFTVGNGGKKFPVFRVV
ncbi:Zn-ribbon domain-containing OB-fold protein [Sulfolobus acidocaldarius]|uniref:Conserved Archaeal protein n=4 Tax=Sulfolobus acidocaldarius TaxID=2285 RepID=Q4J818_SULAC|nr:zinc ribbon domain-containing protein [Sulfolobus acidocaldarius]AAY81064.1 conserved Archaeal protein [Sulfolobus acidocaldarius DSM 639]AGE71671.1 hypothetical protein SacN8_08555 [Sulfolobus acidocaldarius N8]AGE73944.1 hypothetical protein SacRon12I_08565 [Sulfolobus acidocaldarius Ron12/I]ALU30117.1 nucleic acid-binding protein [Sulfolobus acidocaldarius]ALU30811.1 nucleic acid-binding protein [Sulfolobus acidocaldarius]